MWRLPLWNVCARPVASGEMMKQRLSSVFYWLTGATGGIMVFFTFGIARKLFEVYPREVAGEIILHLFPAYYLAA